MVKIAKKTTITPKSVISKAVKKVDKDKKDIITELETLRQSKVIVYITGDKTPNETFATGVASDMLPLFKKILKSFGKTPKITLVIYTNGGTIDTPWPLVNLIREYCDTFEVLVLEKALSAGTLIALGADQIIMGPSAHLSPVDPSTADMSQPQKRIEIEDIIGYIDFIKDKVGISDQATLGEMMKSLSTQITPTMLGSINRTHSLIRRLAKNLISLHKDKIPERQSKDIVEHLTQKLFSHKHLISRREAKELGFEDMIIFPDINTEKKTEELFSFFSELMELEDEFDPVVLLRGVSEVEKKFVRAVVHSNKLKYSFESNYKISTMPDPNGNPQIVIQDTKSGWVKN
jgi:ClpP class serine protease